MRILETLARVELTDGLGLGGLISETAGRMPADATVLAVLADGAAGNGDRVGEPASPGSSGDGDRHHIRRL